VNDPRHIALELSKAIMKGDWATVDALIADDFVYVADGRPPMNKAQYVDFMRHVLCAAMTEMDMKFPRVVCEGDLVAVDYTNAMTHSGQFFGHAPTGRRVVGTGQFMRQVRAGRVVAEWQTTNQAGLMAQLGAAK
jgi:predicted ester cyclase